MAYKLITDLLPVIDAYADMTQTALDYKDAANKLGFVVQSQTNYINQLEQTVKMLVPFVDAANIWALDSFQHEQVLKSVLPFVDAANIWALDSRQHEQVLISLLSCLQDPAFLAYWAFKVWSNQELTVDDIRYLGANFQDLLAPYSGNQQNTTPVAQRGIPYGYSPVTVPVPSQTIPTPTPTNYSSGNTDNPLLKVLTAMRTQGVNGLVNARKAGVI